MKELINILLDSDWHQMLCTTFSVVISQVLMIDRWWELGNHCDPMNEVYLLILDIIIFYICE